MNTPRPGLAVLAVCVLASGCSSAPPDSVASSSSAPPPAAAQSMTAATRAGPLGALTAHGLVQALTDSGLEMRNPVDTTEQECRAVGCLQSVVTDRLRIRSFAETMMLMPSVLNRISTGNSARIEPVRPRKAGATTSVAPLAA